ncbi:MAG: hypothetical protein QG670_954 [Thermoproteota archaeon]|nr:hypothetical protein [Thermoproteota archaeon]
MFKAYVFINVDSGADSEVLQALGKLSNVKEAYEVYGVYDLLAKIESETMEQLRDIVGARIRRLKKVKATVTLTEIQAKP